MKILLKGTEHSDIKVEINGLAIPQEYYDIVDGNVSLNQDGLQFVKSQSKQNYYNGQQRKESQKPY